MADNSGFFRRKNKTFPSDIVFDPKNNVVLNGKISSMSQREFNDYARRKITWEINYASSLINENSRTMEHIVERIKNLRNEKAAYQGELESANIICALEKIIPQGRDPKEISETSYVKKRREKAESFESDIRREENRIAEIRNSVSELKKRIERFETLIQDYPLISDEPSSSQFDIGDIGTVLQVTASIYYGLFMCTCQPVYCTDGEGFKFQEIAYVILNGCGSTEKMNIPYIKTFFLWVIVAVAGYLIHEGLNKNK